MYYQLNTFTGFRFYRSSLIIEEYAKRAKELGYSGIGINDDRLYGFPELAKAAEKYALKPVFGFQFRLSNSKGGYFDATFFIKNEQGYQNLCLLYSLQKKEYDVKTIEKYKEGLILVISSSESFCDKEYLDFYNRDFYGYRKVFSDDFYFGITLSTKEERDNISDFYDFLEEQGYQSIAFPKVCYLKKNDAYKTNLLMASEHFTDSMETPELDREGPFFLLSDNALNLIYRKKELDEEEKLIAKIDFQFFVKRGQLPKFEDEDGQLKNLAFDGLKKKLGMEEIPQNYSKRLEYELDVIAKMHFSGYFLIVDDYVRFARSVSIKVGPGRGSAGGCLVAFALDITKVDPIRFDLTFERFLNPERVTMPDIDIDFEDTRRDEVVDYLKRKYGEERISDIITFSRLKPKSCLNLIGPVLKVNEVRLKALTRSISDKAGDFHTALNDPVKGEAFRKMYSDSYYREICDTAQGLLSLPINTSIHAPGVIISDKPIYLSCPRKNGRTGTVEFEYPNMESLGFLKVDILSLSNLTFIRDIENEIIKNKKTIPDVDNDLDNPKVYETLNNLDLVEIFQLDTSYGMRKTISLIKPNRFTDLAAAIALFRPGPMDYIETFANRKHQKEKIIYSDPRMEPILRETYGIMVYQEQIMKAVEVLAGFSLGEADLFRRAISKKKLSQIQEYHQKFISGCMGNGINEEKAESIFKDIERFAQYGFNKSHAYSYGLITYRLLYYKTFFPDEFYFACLKHESLNSSKMTDIIKELQKRGIRLRNPDINISLKTEPIKKDNSIYLPLDTININENLMDSILLQRNNGVFQSFYDFVRRCYDGIKGDDRKTISSMIEAGFFNCLSKSRIGMKERLPGYLNFAHFDMDPDQVPTISDSGEDIGEMLYLEKMALGRILSCSLERIFHKEGYQTFLVTDVSNLERNHRFQIDNESNRYVITLKTPLSIQKYDFVLIKGFFPYKSIYPQVQDIIPCGRKVVKHE